MKDNKKILLALMLSCFAIFGYLMWQDHKEAPIREARMEQEKKWREQDERRAKEERQRNKQRREQTQQQKSEGQTVPSKEDKPKQQRETQVDVKDALKSPGGVQVMSVRELKANAKEYQGKIVTVGPLYVRRNSLEHNYLGTYTARSIDLSNKWHPVDFDTTEALDIFYQDLPKEQRERMIQMDSKGMVDILFVRGVFKGGKDIIAQDVWIRQYRTK